MDYKFDKHDSRDSPDMNAWKFSEKGAWPGTHDPLFRRGWLNDNFSTWLNNNIRTSRAGLRYRGALSTWQSRCPLGVGYGEGHRSPSPLWGSGYAPKKFFKNQRQNRVLLGIFESWNGLFCSGVKAGLELKYINKITLIIGSDEILNGPHVCSQLPTAHLICLLNIWTKRKCTFWYFAASICTILWNV